MTSGQDLATGSVQRRRVYYIAGFDTRSARHYHQLYQTEAAAQQALSGRVYDVGPSQVTGEHSTAWTVHGIDGEQRVETHYRFLQWNDIIRAHWPASVMRVAASVPAFFWRFATCGALGTTRRLSRPFYWMVMSPLLMTVASLLAALLAGAATAGLVSGWLPGGDAGGGWKLGVAFVIGAAVLALGLAYTEHLRIFWLMRAWTFLWRWICQDIPALDARSDAFAHEIEADLANEAAHEQVDEVLLIGHSAGAMVALSVAARWLALRGDKRPCPPRVKLVTLGNVHPFLGLVPEGGWYRDEMARVAASGMRWVDYTAPADPLCYALVDALAVCGLPPSPSSNHVAKSSRFDRMFEPARYALLRQDFFRIHFQYLMASERPVDNDYFQLTAGPRPLTVKPAA